MPEIKQQEQNDNPVVRRNRFTSWWHNFHFSGRVIMCSVLFGLGLILIGSLLFAINMDDGGKSQDEKFPNEIPSKPPSNVIGPVVMGMGGFIVVVGVTMCLFETQVCRKKTGDSSPLIAEGPQITDVEPAAVPSTSYNNNKHRPGKKTSPKRSKGRQGKSHSKERNQQKDQRTPPISIETTKSFMTSSEDTFLTPPSTLDVQTPLIRSSSRDAENQTSSSLMKSFNSSGPSLNQSTEFQTPSTSFRDTSVSVENSVEIDENQDKAHFSTTELLEKLHETVGFMAPVTLEDEKVKKMSAEIQNQNEENDLQSKETDTNFNKTEDIVFDINNTTSLVKDLENIDTKSIQFQSKNDEVIQKYKIIANENISTGQLSTFNDASTAEDRPKKTAEYITPVHCGDSVHNENEENISKQDFNASLNEDTNKMPNEKINYTEEKYGIDDSTKKSILVDNFLSNDPSAKENNEGDVDADLESSVSSDETLVSQNSFQEKKASNVTLHDKSLESNEKLIVEAENLNVSESENDAKSAQNNSIDIQKSQSTIANESEAELRHDQVESNTLKENENTEKLPNDCS